MAKPLDSFFGLFSGERKKTAPTKTAGVPGTAIYGGYVQNNEKNPAIGSREKKYETYSEILANTSIVAAGTRYFLNLIAKSEWSFNPSEADTSGEYAELAEEMLTSDPVTPWHRIVRRAAMYRFYGFSIQEWTAMRREDGRLTFKDIAPRPQMTITRWDAQDDGTIMGVTQTSPQTSEEIYIERGKLLYMVDDTLSDSPEGLGLFRHLVAPAQRLARYEQLEGIGFETDLRGIPIGRAPLTELAKMVTSGEITEAQRRQIEAPLRDFIQNHIKTAKLGFLMDSIAYESKDEAGRPSSIRQWEVDLLKGGSTSFAENAQAIERLNREMARILGVEQLLLGEGNGSYALSEDKTNSFFLLIDSALTEIREQTEDDLLKTLWKLNGFPPEMMPELGTEAIRHTDVSQIAAVLRDMATAGAPLAPEDPVVQDVREMLGVSPAIVVETSDQDEDAALTSSEQSADDDEMPDDEEDDAE